ncbi:type I-E CRISPR-associated protein Cas7/Cse4/CasC [Corynebacterium mendelii]|uniref:Type I-E CRISPR-associated protein Cas7/Cse4/CasC n=1 Tax=Corynebacterium mendelii TaxID=2765362 RepID=A0A939DZT0_9CORY|nr:type I-E CRISPR-associated protein Cas7/Cse4/CasC [Corynebacterium mendelii]MBN9644274.1 type I-E CRISPR-associated protein Cas7/Cse4/CasC [Corynebacterium mendelii]
MSIFVDLHILQSLPPSCVNRDDTGSPKRAVYGGVDRARVSSQAWKHATRVAFADYLDPEKIGTRTLYAIELIVEKVQESGSSYEPAEIAKAAATVLSKAGIKTEKAKERKNPEGEKVSDSPYPISKFLLFISPLQVEALAKLTVSVLEGEKISPKDARAAASEDTAVDMGLFGRMVADEPSLTVDAACQVAHALSVSGANTEFDYFTAVDDKPRADRFGAGMIGTVEFVSATFYRYATVNMTVLAENLGSMEAAEEALSAFIRAFTTSMPTGKQNTFANRTRPGFVAAQVRDDQPVNLVGSFETPIESDNGIMSAAVASLVNTSIDEDAQFGTKPVGTSFLATKDALKGEAAEALEAWGKPSTLDEVITATLSAIRSASEV